MALSTLVFSTNIQTVISAQNNQTPAVLSATTNASSFAKKISVGTSVANAAVGGGDEVAAFITSIPFSSSATIDLTSLTDILSSTGITLARVKSLTLWLLDATDDATNGTAASSVTVGNNGANDFISQTGNRGWFGTAASTFDIPSGGYVNFGTKTANGVVVDGTHKIIKLANNDGALSAKIMCVVAGGST